MQLLSNQLSFETQLESHLVLHYVRLSSGKEIKIKKCPIKLSLNHNTIYFCLYGLGKEVRLQDSKKCFSKKTKKRKNAVPIRIFVEMNDCHRGIASPLRLNKYVTDVDTFSNHIFNYRYNDGFSHIFYFIISFYKSLWKRCNKELHSHLNKKHFFVANERKGKEGKRKNSLTEN